MAIGDYTAQLPQVIRRAGPSRRARRPRRAKLARFTTSARRVCQFIPAHSRLCAAGTQEEGEPHGSPCLLRITTPSFRARCARKGKSRFPPAARLPQRVSRTGATPEMTRRGRRALRSEGWSPPLLVSWGKWAAEALALRTLRAQRALICGSKCHNSLGTYLCACSHP